jgi:G3E family GTPase
VIGGFLGAGKTTLLNHWLRNAGGVRMAVLVNDFGAINIDAELVAASSGDTIALTNGCVCCQIGDDLTGALIRVLDAEAPFDAVVVEASGVSDPWRIAQIGRATPELMLDGVIVLVDASAIIAQSRDPLLADTLERQLLSADLIVVNHCDQTDEEQRAQVRTWIATVAGDTPVYETAQAVVPLAMLSGLALPEAAAAPQAPPPHDHAHDHVHDDPAHGDQFDTWSCRPARVFPAAELRALLRDMPAGVLRLKGILRTDDHGWVELQFAGRHGSLHKAVAAPAGAAAVVAIGLHQRLPSQTLESVFGTSAANGGPAASV